MRRPGRPFWIGVASGVALLLLARWAINESTIPDRLVAPLLLGDSTARAEAIVVLGGGVIGDCVPNLNSMRRTVRAARLFRDGRADLLVITGGMAGGACPVADGMREFAGELGVPADRMVVEREARSTWENAALTAPLLHERGVRRILLVTDRMHMLRASGAFARQGFEVEPAAVPVYEGHPDNVSMLGAGLREVAALAYYRLRGWTASAPEAALNPAGASVRASTIDAQQAAAPPADTRSDGPAPVVLLGASYAASWPLAEVAGVTVVNRGVPGQQTFEMLERFERDVVAVRPRAVILWGFINDIFRSSDDELPRALARTRASVSGMIDRARAADIEPILATEVTVRPPKRLFDSVMATAGWLLGRRSNQDRVNQLVADLNQWVRDTGQREGLLVLDLQRVLADGDGPRKWAYAVEDGSHISPAGYRALSDYATPLVARRLGLASATETRRP
ncbi:MAG: ElyC/SanA/YdcF family protein [Vicinamibacterales bacterium]